MKQNRWDSVPFTFLVLFSQKNHCFIKENKLSEKVVIAEEELNRIDIDGIENLEGSPRFASSTRNVAISKYSIWWRAC